MFQLVTDPSGVVVDTTIRKLVPSLLKWGNNLDHIIRKLRSYILSSAQRSPPLSGVEGSMESNFRVLGERERWSIDVLLRLLVELLPHVYQKAVETCPFQIVLDKEGCLFSTSVFEMCARESIEWPAFDWLHLDCFPDLIQLASFLSPKEDNLRNQIAKFLLAVTKQFGESYLTHIMLPVFLVAVGDNTDLAFFSNTNQSRIKGLKPKTVLAKRLAKTCVLPIILAGVLGNPNKHEQLTEYLRNLLVEKSDEETHQVKQEIINSVRFLCTFEEHQTIIFNILWEMVLSSNIDQKISAVNLLKVIVPYIDAKVTSTHVLPALVTLGSDQTLSVKYASIDAFGSVAQHFKNDMIVDKIRVQMDAFIEDGSHEATIAVIRALAMAIPHTADTLRDYLLSKIFQLTTNPPLSSDVIYRRERSNAFCESIRALDATDLPPTSVKNLLIPAIQNLLKDYDALDPAHKEALEIILKDRSGGTIEAISKVMGAHMGLASSVTSFFGDSGLLGKKDSGDLNAQLSETFEQSKSIPPPPVEDTRFKRIMRGSFTEMLRGKTKGMDDTTPHSQ